MAIGAYQDYRKYLRSVFEDRTQHNSRYSMRAFARDIGLTSARLSEVLNGKKGLSVDSATAIAGRLSLNLMETRYFCDLITAQHARTANAREIAKTRLHGTNIMADYKLLKDDEFDLIGEWYHLAILELIGESGTSLTAKEMAHRLGINKLLADEALQRLARLSLIAIDGPSITRTTKGVETTNKVPSEAIRSHHQQILSKAKEALSTQPILERDFSSITVSFDRTRAMEAKQLIEQFKRDFLSLVETSSGPKSDVYALGIQLFNLTPALPEPKSMADPKHSTPPIKSKSKSSSHTHKRMDV